MLSKKVPRLAQSPSILLLFLVMGCNHIQDASASKRRGLSHLAYNQQSSSLIATLHGLSLMMTHFNHTGPGL